MPANMKLKYEYQADSEIPTAYRDLYTEQNGKYVLAEVEGVEPAAKVSDYRNNNIQLKRERDELRQKLEPLEHVDLAKYEELRQKESDLRDEKLFKKDKIDEVVQNRTLTLREDYEKRLKKEAEEKANLMSKLSELTIDRTAADIAAKRKVRPEGISFVVDRVRATAKLENGIPVIYKNGEKAYGKAAENGGLKTIEEEVDEIVTSAPFLLEGNAGGGGSSATRGTNSVGGGGSYAGPNPWKKDEETGRTNLTKQMEIAKKDPVLAKRLRDEAGVHR